MQAGRRAFRSRHDCQSRGLLARDGCPCSNLRGKVFIDGGALGKAERPHETDEALLGFLTSLNQLRSNHHVQCSG
jgi:hypothetical protein